MRDLLDKLSILENLEESNTPEIGDEFGISFSPDFEISTHVVEVLEDGIVVELDDTALEMLTNEGVRFFEGELVEGVAGPKSCWKGYRKTGTQAGTGKNAGKRVNDCEKIKEDDVEESGLQYYTGVKKHGKEYMTKAAQAARDGASQKELGALKDKYSKAYKEESIEEAEKKGLYYYVNKRKAAGTSRDASSPKAPTAQAWKDAAKTAKKEDMAEGDVDEAKYQGREVQLGKKMAGDVKKSKVYVKNPQGNIVKVNFGDKKMRIKKSNPARRKSFRARHNCANPGPRHKARYWSCRSW